MSDPTYKPEDAEAAPIRDKQGHKCCGCCCDTRRAVLIVNIIMIVFAVITTIALIAGKQLLQQFAEDADDDGIKEAADEVSNIPIGLIIVIQLVQIVLFGMGILGALNYNSCFVIVALIAYCVAIILNLVNFSPGAVIMSALFAYPHVIFLQEMRSGIMTPENYYNEVHSCCCV